MDACQLADTFKIALDGDISMQDAVRRYQQGMRPRAIEAVEQSRQAAFEAHSYVFLSEEGCSPLLEDKRSWYISGGHVQACRYN